jgi:hypothetical protein
MGDFATTTGALHGTPVLSRPPRNSLVLDAERRLLVGCQQASKDKGVGDTGPRAWEVRLGDNDMALCTAPGERALTATHLHLMVERRLLCASTSHKPSSRTTAIEATMVGITCGKGVLTPRGALFAALCACS